MIVVESPYIGIGKTELVHALARRIRGSISVLEQVPTDLLAEFYKDIEEGVKPSPNAMRLQYWYMERRYRQHLEALEYEWKHRAETIFDRSIWGDHGFAYNLYEAGYLSTSDYRVYVRHRDAMERQLLAPHIVIRLRTEPEYCIARIKHRMGAGVRECEVAVTTEYLESVRVAYDNVVWGWFEERDVPILDYEWSNGSWDSFPDVDGLLEKVGEVLPSWCYIGEDENGAKV